MRPCIALACVLVVGCGSSSPLRLEAPPPPPPPDPMAMCTARDPIPAPSPRAVPGYPFFLKTYTPEELAARAGALRTPDWPQIELDRFGRLTLAASRPKLRSGAYAPQSESGPSPDDSELVRRFVEVHPDLFGPDPADRVVRGSAIGEDYRARFWGNGSITIESRGRVEPLVKLAMGDRAVPAPLPPGDLVRPWVGTEIVRTPQGEPIHPCDPVTPSGDECAQSPAPPPPPSVSRLEPGRVSAPTMALRGDPPAMRSVVQVELQPDERPCLPIPRTIDAVTGEVLEWSEPR